MSQRRPARAPAIDLAAVLRKDLRRFERMASRAADSPTADRVHDARVVTRRLRADLWLIPRGRRRGAIRDARADLEQLAGTLGEQRQYNVALDDARRLGQPTGRIERRLKAARRGVRRALRPRRRRHCVRAVRRAIREARRLPGGAVVSRIRRIQRSLKHTLRHPPRRSAARHRLRINVKKTRYVLEAAHCPAPELARLQDQLGQWHDLVVLGQITGHPSRVRVARQRAWRRAARHLRPALQEAIQKLSGLVAARSASSNRSPPVS